MHLQQTRRFAPTYRFSIDESHVIVRSTSLTSTRRYDVELEDLDPRPSECRNLALGWLVAGGLCVLASVAALVTVYVRGLDGAALWFCGASFASLTGAALCLHRAWRRSYEHIAFHFYLTGRTAFVMRRAVPTKRHVDEFVDILRACIKYARKELDERPF